MQLFLDIGHCDRSTKRGVLSGRTLAVVSDAIAGADHGVLLACAEGLPDRPDVEQAAKTAATALGDAYYLATETDAPRGALKEAFEAANVEVRTRGERGRAAVIAAVVLHGRRLVVGNVGNVRVWRYREHRIQQLTRDHLAPRALRRTEVTRACGLADTIEADCREESLKEGDVVFVTSAGVHEVLPGSTILGVLQSDHTAQQMADLLTQHAITARATGYVGACVARVEKLPPPTAAGTDAATLPMVALPKPGVRIDEFAIEKLLLKNRRFALYRAEDRETGNTVALRFPDPSSVDGASGFLRAERIARRIESPFILRPIALTPGRRTALYSVIEYRRMENLEKRIRRKHGLPLAHALRLGEQLLAALETLHAHGSIDCDVRAHSLFYDKFTQQLWMLGLTMDQREAAPQDRAKPRSSTLSYRAPELLRGEAATERSDVYAAGVTIYRMLAAEYPRGRIRSTDDWQHPRRYVPLRQHNDALPGELDDVLERACAADAKRRYATVEQFGAALSTVRARAVDRAPASAAANTADDERRWPWWLVGVLGAGLCTYLYFVLR